MIENRSDTVSRDVGERSEAPRWMRAGQHQPGRNLAEVLAESATDQDRRAVLERLADSLGCRFESEPAWVIAPELVASVPHRVAREYKVVPHSEDATGLEVLAWNPFDPRLEDDLAFMLGRQVRVAVADPERVAALLEQHYPEDGATFDQLLRDMAAFDHSALTTQELSSEDIESLAGQKPIVGFVSRVLSRAIRERASDVHFEPFEHEFRVRLRIDGVLQELPPPPAHLSLAITSRLKVLAELNIAERRAPQDGRIKLVFEGRPVDLRVSTLPTQFGESVVLRVLDRTAVQLDLTQLGMPEAVFNGVSEIVRRPNGILIVTGPTGSGKTTTLYSALRTINVPGTKLLTAEDPVEYELEGVMQVPINPGIGLTFASALRSFLRQDPDVVMIGEIRDLETAQIAIQASLTGHLVLSTLHTNNAAGAITRLIDMGVEPFLIASTVEAVLAQRLVRKTCPHCRTIDTPELSMVHELGFEPVALARGDVLAAPVFTRGRGCEHCGQTGYRGRQGIFEWLRISDDLRELILRHAPTHALEQKAREQGMLTLLEDGRRAVVAGITTIEELARCT